MQKKIIALAVAALASTAAFAQSNVTIYGIMDSTFDNVGASSGATAANNVRLNRVSFNSSYLGFKGVEDLGNGLKAVFQLEGGVAPDAGAAFSLSRDSYLAVASGFGTIAAGQLTGPTRALGGAVDVNAGATGIGANSALLGKLGNNLTNLTTDANGAPAITAAGRSQTQASTFDTRWKNAIAYISPSFSGLTVTAAYVANENKLGNAAGAGINTSGYDVGLNYANGPIMAGLTYNAVRIRNEAATALVTHAGVTGATLGTNIKTNDLRAGGSYDFGVAKLAAIYDRVNLKSASTALDLKQNVYGLGLTVPVSGKGKVIAQYYKAQDVKNLAGEQGARLYEIGYVHDLSKRTSVRAVYANLNNNANVNYDFGVNATGLASNDATVSGVQVGVRHSF